MIICGNSAEELRKIESSSVQCCITSPPYYKLRDYGCPEQIGQEKTLTEYIESLKNVFMEIHRVLKDDGTLWINIGDTYSGTGNSLRPEGRAGYGTERVGLSNTSYLDSEKKLPPKNLLGVPWRLAFLLQDSGWILRQDIIWRKPNPMPSSVTDRCTTSHEYLFLLVKNQKYYFDGNAIKEPVSDSYKKDKRPRGVLRQRLYKNSKYAKNGFYNISSESIEEDIPLMESSEDTFRNKHSVWDITVKPFRGSHFAVMPIELVTNCILAGTREKDTVIDPFFGAGTVGLGAIKTNRNFIGIELNPEYVEIAKRRLSMEQPCFL